MSNVNKSAQTDRALTETWEGTKTIDKETKRRTRQGKDAIWCAIDEPLDI